MSKQRKKKGLENELSEYPVIYSYIYERESEDIKRLSEKFKSVKFRPDNPETSQRTITSYRIENGKAVPVYDDGTKSNNTTEKK